MLQNHNLPETSVTEALIAPTTGTETTLPAPETIAADSEAELAEWIACVQEGPIRYQRRSRRYLKVHFSLMIASIIGLCAWMFIVFNGMRHGSLFHNSIILGLLPPIIAVVIIMASLGGGITWLRKDRSTAQELAATEKLLQLDDVRVVGPLIDTSGLHAAALRPAFWQAMERLLPRMTEEELQQLGPKRHAAMASWIKGWGDPNLRKFFDGADTSFLLNLLPVMARIGRNTFPIPLPPVRITVSLLPILKRWASGKGAGKDPIVRQVALDCREAIQQKMSVEHPEDQLLRASSATPTGQENLLRSAQGNQTSDPKELLRPDQNSESRL